MRTEKYERDDACYGLVSSRCRKGAYVLLDNGEMAFCYEAGNLFPGTKIICSVKRSASESQNGRCLVKMDSVCDLYDVA